MDYFDFADRLKDNFTKEGLIDFISNYDTYLQGSNKYLTVLEFYQEFYPSHITSKQIKCIHTLASKLELRDKDYRDLLEIMFKVNTCKDLTEKQASTFIDILNKLVEGEV